ncbi:MAG: single-stranded DNA-binding protein [Candidatus Pacebacteria bacterium]|nr:single-stranded DNA-binding protein [Candidatus Paceibacterota bacterium]
MNLNKVFLIGRVANVPEIQSTQSGRKVCKLSLATSRIWKGQDGSKKEETNFHNIILWERLAEIASSYATKGSLLLIEGRIQNRSWEDKEGKKRYTTEIIAENIQLGPKPNKAAGISDKPKKQKEEIDEELPVIDEDEIDIKDIPF